MAASSEPAGYIVAAGGPVASWLDQQPLPVSGHRGVGGRVDPDQVLAADLVTLTVEEVGRAGDARRRSKPGVGSYPMPTLTSVTTPENNVLASASGCPRRHRLTMRGYPDSVSESGPKSVPTRTVSGVVPGGVGLRLGQDEPVDDELPCRHVEFAQHRGVRPGRGQADEGQCEVGFDDLGAGPHPVLAIGFGQGIEIDEHVPGGRLGAVVVQGGALPQAARVVGVPPEVVEVVATAPDVRDAGIRVEDLECLRAHLLGTVRRRVPRASVRCVGGHPVERGVTADVLQPQVRVFSHGTHCGGSA